MACPQLVSMMVDAESFIDAPGPAPDWSWTTPGPMDLP